MKRRAQRNRKGLASAGPFVGSIDKQIRELEMAERERQEKARMTEVLREELRPLIDAIDHMLADLAAIQAGGGRRIKVGEAPPQFHIGDKVRAVIEGTLVGYNRDEGHYYLKGNSTGADHIDWLHTLHWATEFEVLEEGPRNLGDGATNAGDAWAGTTEGGACE